MLTSLPKARHLTSLQCSFSSFSSCRIFSSFSWLSSCLGCSTESSRIATRNDESRSCGETQKSEGHW